MWLACDPQRFWAGVDPNITAKTLAATRAELHNIADGGCFRGVACQPDDRPTSHSHCPLMAPNAAHLGLRNIRSTRATAEPGATTSFPSWRARP